MGREEKGGWCLCEVRDTCGDDLWKAITKEWDLFNTSLF